MSQSILGSGSSLIVSGVLGAMVFVRPATADEEHDAVPIVTAAGLTKTMAPRTPETISELPLPRIDCDIHDYYRNIAAVVNGEAEQIVTHDQQRQLMKLMEAIFESAEKNQVVYF